jgi:hypothetical protein
LAVIAGKTEDGEVKLGEGWKKLKIQWDLKAADEGHRFANPDSLQTRAACKIPADKRLVMSWFSVFQNGWRRCTARCTSCCPTATSPAGATGTTALLRLRL